MGTLSPGLCPRNSGAPGSSQCPPHHRFAIDSVTYSVAIEVDMPWKDDLPEHGDSFKPWTEDIMSPIMTSIISGLPHNQLTTIVSVLLIPNLTC